MKKILFSILVLIALTLTACGGGGSNAVATLAPAPADFAGKTNPLGADAATAGAVVFKTNCEQCHGPQGHGDGPAGAALDPKPKNLAELQTTAGDDFFLAYQHWQRRHIHGGMEGYINRRANLAGYFFHPNV